MTLEPPPLASPAKPAPATPDRGRRQLSNNTYRLISAGTFVGLLLIWYVVTTFDLVSKDRVVPPGELFEEFGDLLSNGYSNTPLLQHVGLSLSRVLGGFALAAVMAVPIGLIMGMSRLVRAILGPIFAVLRPIPAIAYIPLAILWLGIGETAKVGIVFLTAFLYIVLNTMSGVSSVPAGYRRVALNLGASRAQMFKRVIFPAALPYIFTGLKTGLAVSWAVMVAAELVAAQAGLGYIIIDAATFFRISDVYIGIFFIGVIGLLMATVLDLFESKLVHWAGK